MLDTHRECPQCKQLRPSPFPATLTVEIDGGKTTLGVCRECAEAILRRAVEGMGGRGAYVHVTERG